MKNIEPENIAHFHIFNTHFKPLSYSELNSVAIKKEKTINFRAAEPRGIKRAMADLSDSHHLDF
ncbi:MAG TPA: hypothetical protein VF692_00305 [Pyrinomonadaceae bacterium]|jgi:hypothetical protein